MKLCKLIQNDLHQFCDKIDADADADADQRTFGVCFRLSDSEDS